MNVAPWVHWYMAAFCGVFGAVIIAVRAHFGDVCTLIPCIRDDAAAQERLHRVLEQRSSIEAVPESLGMILGVCSLVLGVIAAQPQSPVILLYALLTLVLALGLAAVYVRLRGTRRRRRAASLVARRPWLVVPWYVFAVAFLGVLSPLLAVKGGDVTGALVVFFGFTIQHITPVTGLAYAYVCVLLCAFVLWQFRLTQRAPSRSEVALWTI